MVSEALYRKYRSKSFEEIVGQEGVVSALKNAIKNNKISHAYLFTGPRGTGKTSVARILAHEINELEYSLDQLPIDIIEIDAASNRGIEEIRELRERVRIAPISSKYKVYIIDEVHMLTTPAFNALLKTLEEPPAHVIFILATTESHKLPETILSRTQRYNFKLASKPAVAKHLKSIAKLEKIKIDDEAIDLVSEHSGGSLRDALSLLDHVRHLSDEITGQTIHTSIGLPSQSLVGEILEAIATNNAKQVIQGLEESQENNIGASSLAEGLVHELTKRLKQSTNTTLPISKVSKLLSSLITVGYSPDPDVSLTVALLSVIDIQDHITSRDHPKAQDVVVEEPIKPYKKQQKEIPKEKTLEKPSAGKEDKPKAVTIDKAPEPLIGSTSLNSDLWKVILEDIRTNHNTLYSVLRMATFKASNEETNKIILSFSFPFHQKRINDSRNKQKLIQTLEAHGFTGIEIECVVDKAPSPKPNTADKSKAEPSKNDDEITNVINVFGTAEVLE